MLIVRTACATRREAERIGETLVREKIAACATVFPCKSFYFWKGKLQRQEEFALELKIRGINRRKAERRILQLHAYDVPMIISLAPKSVNASYRKWVGE